MSHIYVNDLDYALKNTCTCLLLSEKEMHESYINYDELALVSITISETSQTPATENLFHKHKQVIILWRVRWYMKIDWNVLGSY